MDDTEMDLEPTSTPTKVTFAPTVQTRFDIRISVPPSPVPDQEVISVFWEVINKLTSHIPDLKVMSWSEESTLTPISSRVNFPRDFPIFKHYLEGVYPRIQGGFLYGWVSLSTSQSIKENTRYITEWMKQNGHGLYPRAIQDENVSTLGWILHSTLSTGQTFLSKILSEKVES